MTVNDRQQGYVAALTEAKHDSWNNPGTSSGGPVTYLKSNGLDVATGRSEGPRNNDATMTVQYNKVRADAVAKVLTVELGPEASCRSVFPTVGSDLGFDGHTAAVTPPEWLQLNGRPSLDVNQLGLAKQTLEIAGALHRYGFCRVWPPAWCGPRFLPRGWDTVAGAYAPSKSGGASS